MYKDPAYTGPKHRPSAPASTIGSDEGEDAPEVPLEELLDNLAALDIDDDEGEEEEGMEG